MLYRSPVSVMTTLVVNYVVLIPLTRDAGQIKTHMFCLIWQTDKNQHLGFVNQMCSHIVMRCVENMFINASTSFYC